MYNDVTRRSVFQLTGAALALPAFQSNLLEIGPMAFTPKFVDLVRNVATVTGTGPVTLGPAVNGYASLAGAVSAGDQFYYCIQGIDKPAEREIGRGTMQADGKVARQAITGALTNFTGGTKTIALVAAAEWFAALDQMAAGAASSASSRTELAARQAGAAATAVLREAGREGLFLFEASDLSANVSADPAQGIHVAPASDPTGASGAWVRRHDGPVNVRWFGARGDNVTNDGPAFAAAIAYLKSTRLPVGYGYGQGSGELFVPAGQYFLGTTTVDLSHTINIRGEAMGLTGGGSSVLRWAAGATGIRVQAFNTEGATGFNSNASTSPAGSGSTIEKLFLKGGYSGSEGEFHGIHLRGMATVRDVYISNFQGDGIHAAAAVGSGAGGIEGNVNLTRILGVNIDNCRNGIYFDSADSNACTIIAANCTSNRAWGIWDSSFLGNSYFGCHVAANGRSAGALPTACVHGGNHYYVKPGQAAGAAINAPSGTSTDNQWWGYIGAGGTAPGIVSWASGTIFREGGAYKTDSASARNLFEGCYSEGDQNPSQFVTPTVVMSGLHGADLKGSAAYLRSETSGAFLGTLDPAAYVNFSNGQTTPCRVSASGMEPVADNSVDLGTNGLKWRNVYTVGLTCTGNLSVTGPNQSIGPTAGAGADLNLYFENTNFNHFLTFRSWSGGAPQTDATIRARRGNGLELNGTVNVKLQQNGGNIAIVDASGLDLQPGKVLKVGGTQVVGPRGAALPADATDLASAIALVNAIKARLKASGGHGLVAD